MPNQKSVRANMVPQGGPSVTTEASQSQPILPDTLTLKRMSEQLMESCEINVIQINQQPIVPGQVTNLQVNNVGLGESLELDITGSVTLTNTAGVAQAVSFSPEFPFNLLSNIILQFNGQTVIVNLSGYEALAIMAKRNKGVFLGGAAASGTAFAQNITRVDRTLAWMTAGANATFTAGNNITGTTSVSIAAGLAGVINFGFHLEIPFTVRKDLLLGLLPMQNNSVFLNVQLTSPALLGATAASPMFVAGGVPATLSMTASAINVFPHYNFWSIPNPNNPALYGYLCSHNYLLLSQANVPLTQTGAEALQYTMPNNYYLMSLLLTLRDSAGALVDVPSMLNNAYLNYNGTARIDRRLMANRMARQRMQYEGIPSNLGQLLWDGTAEVDYLQNGMNTSRWLNMYMANNPLFVADVAATLAIPATYSVLREQLVPANVMVV